MRMSRVLAAASCLLVIAAVSSTKPLFAEESDGKVVFQDQKCSLCHSVSTVGIKAKTANEDLKGPDLVNLAASYKADWVVRYVKKEVDKEGKSHTKPFKGSDEELQVLVDWLLEQKAEG